MVEVRLFLDDYSSLVSTSQYMLLYDVNQALHDYLQAIFDVVGERTVSFCTEFTSKAETHAETLIQNAL